MIIVKEEMVLGNIQLTRRILGMQLDKRIIKGSLVGISLLLNSGNLYATNGEIARIEKEAEITTQKENMRKIINYIKDNSLNYLTVLL